MFRKILQIIRSIFRRRQNKSPVEDEECEVETIEQNKTDDVQKFSVIDCSVVHVEELE